METLGLIETKGFLSAIVAADAAVKSANVTIIRAEKIKGGYVTVQLVGDVGAVKAAVDIAVEAIEPFGTLISSHVIPRMHTETTKLINPKKEAKEEKEDLASQTVELSTLGEEEDLVEEHAKEEKQPEKKQIKETKPLKQEELEQMTVPELRKLVMERNVEKDNTNTMKYAKKAELVKHLLNEENKN